MMCMLHGALMGAVIVAVVMLIVFGGNTEEGP